MDRPCVTFAQVIPQRRAASGGKNWPEPFLWHFSAFSLLFFAVDGAAVVGARAAGGWYGGRAGESGQVWYLECAFVMVMAFMP